MGLILRKPEGLSRRIGPRLTPAPSVMDSRAVRIFPHVVLPVYWLGTGIGVNHERLFDA